ncbi:MAG: DeoR family transcriptional regulator [bacterium]|nr:DeoR family transcriptional regulator [bacterium]
MLTNQNSFVVQKSQQISLALIKLSVQTHRKEFRQRLERLAFDLVETINNNDAESAVAVLSATTGMIGFGKTIYEIEPINAKVMIEQIDNLLGEFKNSAVFAEVDSDLSDIFSIKDGAKDNDQDDSVSTDYSNSKINGNGHTNGNGNGISATIRQSAIIDVIRQSGNMAMRDLVVAFPEVSERTLRYDLQKLCDQNEIERVGNGGPASYYTIRKAISV